MDINLKSIIIFIIFIISFLVLFLFYISIKYYFKSRNEKKTLQILQTNFEKGYLEEINKKEIDKKEIGKDLGNQDIASINIKEKKNIFYKGSENWKYTKNDNDLDCLINWDYYDSDKKTLILSNIPKTTMVEKNNKWCATKENTSLSDRMIPENKLLTTLQGIGTVAIGTGIQTGIAMTATKIIKTINNKALLEAQQKALQEAQQKALQEAEQKAIKEAEQKALQEAQQKALHEAEQKALQEAEQKALQEAQQKAIKEAEQRALQEVQLKALHEAQLKALQEAQQKALLEAEQRALQEAQLKALQEAQLKALQEAQLKALLEAEQRALQEAQLKALQEAEQKAIKEAEQKALQEAAENAIKDAQEKALKEAAEKAIKDAQEKALKEAAEALLKETEDAAIKLIKPKLFSKILFNMQAKELLKISKSLVGNKTIIKNIVKNLGELAGKTTAKLGVKASLNLSKLAVALKPSPATILDIFSAALDIADIGGYGKMQTKVTFSKLVTDLNKTFKNTMLDEFEKQFKTMNIPFNRDEFAWPLIYNPLDDVENLDNKIQEKLQIILNDSNNKYMKIVNESIKTDLENGILKIEDLENETILNKYTDLLDVDLIIKDINIEFCKLYNGIIYDDDKCTLSEEKCNVWPLPNDKDGNPLGAYREFKDGKCIMASPTIREICEDMQLKYDINTGTCIIDEAYCKKKGAEWLPNKKINNEYDCMVPMEQQIAETIFGTTITRGLKQVFDPDQWKTCGYDDKIKTYDDKCINIKSLDDGTLLEINNCNNPINSQFYYNSVNNTISSIANLEKCWNVKDNNINSKIEIQKCNNLDNQKFVYDENTKKIMLNSDNTKCLDINNNNLIISNCSDITSQKFSMGRNKIKDSGFTCSQIDIQPAKCPPGYTNNLLTCGRGADTAFLDSGRPADCPSGYKNMGATCLRDAHTAFMDDGRLADCPPSYKNMGATCFRDVTSFQRDYWSKAGKPISYDIKQCENRHGQGNCEEKGVKGSRIARVRDCKVEAKNKDLPNWEFYTPDSLSTMGSRCYIYADSKGMDEMRCNSDEFRSGGRCYKNCPSGYSHTGVSCYRGPDTKQMDEMTCNTNEFKKNARCYRQCPEGGYTHTGVSCYRGPSIISIDNAKCDSGEVQITGQCFKIQTKCLPGYTNVGLACTREKERKYKFSTQKN